MRSSGLTLLELLIGVVLGGVAVASAASVMVSHLNSTNATTWAVQLQRELSRFDSLLNSEAREACLMMRGTPPAPRNNPLCMRRTASCAVFAGPATTFTLITPLDYTGIPSAPSSNWPSSYVKWDPPVELRAIYTYNSGTRQVSRNGYGFFPDGRIGSLRIGNTLSINLNTFAILDNVTAFTPIVSADCRSATITVTLAVPTYPTITRTQTIRVAANTAYNYEQFIP